MPTKTVRRPKHRPKASVACSARRSNAVGKILFRYRASDTLVGMSRGTVARLAKTLGLSETQTIHLALARLAQEAFPRYEPDGGDLTDTELAAIRKLEPQGRMVRTETLFP